MQGGSHVAEKLSAKSAWKLNNALKKSAATKPTKVGTARVTRRDSDGSMWVRLPGSNVDTPVNGQVLSDAQVGDTVSVRIENGRLSLMGNASTPSVGQQQVNTTVQPVRQTADNALETASTAQTAAELATSYAAAAQQSASAAQTSADAAQTSADEATASASTANTAAQGALLGLSTVEDVVSVLQWLSEHGHATDDATVDPSTKYYARDDDAKTVRLVTEPEATLTPRGQGWRELVATADEEVAEGKSYYAIDQQTGLPVRVDDPTGDPSAQGWYELPVTEDTSVAEGKSYYEVADDGTVSLVADTATPLTPVGQGWWVLDDAVTDYVGAHLAMTDHGLNVAADERDGYIHVGTLTQGGSYGTYIIEGGKQVAKFAQETVIGPEDGMHVTVRGGQESGRLLTIANGGDEPVMYVQVDVDPTTREAKSTVYMTNAIVVQDLRFGRWMWYERANGNMSVRWTGDDS